MPLLYRIYDERIMAKPIFMPTIGLIMAMGYFNVKSKDVVVGVRQGNYSKRSYDKKTY